jgi:hypothetical protein
MSKKADDRQADKARRFRSVRIDCKVGALESEIAKVFGLPRGCVKIVGRDGKGKRSEATVNNLLAEWDGW